MPGDPGLGCGCPAESSDGTHFQRLRRVNKIK
jgi:hypothetical protein